MAEYKNDEIFLLSKEEYEFYNYIIPPIGEWWWLRSPGYNSDHADTVNSYGSVSTGGNVRVVGAVRPVLKISSLESTHLSIGASFVKYGITWEKIDSYLAIAREPIGHSRFSDSNNDYELSYIRQQLLSLSRGADTGIKTYWVELITHGGIPIRAASPQEAKEYLTKLLESDLPEYLKYMITPGPQVIEMGRY